MQIMYIQIIMASRGEKVYVDIEALFTTLIS